MHIAAQGSIAETLPPDQPDSTPLGSLKALVAAKLSTSLRADCLAVAKVIVKHYPSHSGIAKLLGNIPKSSATIDLLYKHVTVATLTITRPSCLILDFVLF